MCLAVKWKYAENPLLGEKFKVMSKRGGKDLEVEN